MRPNAMDATLAACGRHAMLRQSCVLPAETTLMVARPTVRKLEPAEWPTYRDLRLRSLADSPDAFGSTLAAEQARTAQDWAERLARGATSGLDLPLIAEVDRQAAGLAWAKVEASDPSIINLYQMWVAPEFRGHGAGRLLLRAAIEWARSRNAAEVRLGVTWGDTPAVRLYTREGFAPFGPPGNLRPGSPLPGRTMRLQLDPRAA
jgi:GNAT superfamily N-acetyltransferase